MIIKETVYCNSLNDPTDDIEITYYKYNKSDTLLIEQSYGVMKGNKIDLVYLNFFSYIFNNNNQLLKKRTIDSVDNDIEEETFFYNEVSQLYEKKTDFFNKSGDTIRFYFINKYEYNNAGKLLKDVFISDNDKYERLYSYDSLGNRLNYKYKGVHTDGYDLDNYSLKYNRLSKPILNEVGFASGEKIAYKYSYDKSGTLLSVLVLRKFLRNSHFRISKKNSDSIPPPPPPPSESDYKKNYNKDYKYCYVYDLKGHIIKINVKHFRFNLMGDIFT